MTTMTLGQKITPGASLKRLFAILRGSPGMLAYSLLASLWLFLASPLVSAGASDSQVMLERVIGSYIDAWRDFYPSRAFAYGDVEAAAAFEDYDDVKLSDWLAFNESTSESVAVLLARPQRDIAPRRVTDARVLLAQTRNELATWAEDAPISSQPQWYAEQVSQALTHLLVRDQLSVQGRSDALVLRLQGVERLCELGQQALQSGNAMRTERALRVLKGSQQFYESGLQELVADWPAPSSGESLKTAITSAVTAMVKLRQHLEQTILPGAPMQADIGLTAYSAKLDRRTSGLYTPDSLRSAAAQEVQSVRTLMVQEAARWVDTQEDAAARAQLADLADDTLLAAALDAMEADRQSNSADFLASFTSLTFAAERFVQEHRLATVPKPTTLHIALSPAHFSGAAVGGVYPSGPFDTQADTLFYVPSVPDDVPESVKEDFYRSFNTHFNTMILSHEMFPGHYLQYKVAVSEAPVVRSLFSNGSYVEGWVSFVEELMLDAGWAGNAPLTRLAHLRKRLENATRAYVSVQVNTAGWGEAKVLKYARDEGLLAPQFATNLWQRVVNSPLQITDYFTGYRAFVQLYSEHLAAAETAPTQVWVDAVLRAGPLPMALLEQEIQR